MNGTTSYGTPTERTRIIREARTYVARAHAEGRHAPSLLQITLEALKIFGDSRISHQDARQRISRYSRQYGNLDE